MKQLNYVGNRKFEWFDVPEPTITGSDQVIGKPIVMGRCDGDTTASLPGIAGVLEAGNQQKMVDPMVHHCLGEHPYQSPFPIGHESVCEIVAIGADVSLFKVGDRVVVPWAVSCGSCLNCQRKLTSNCQNAGELKNNFDPRLVQTHVFKYSEADKVYGKSATKLILISD